MIYYTRYPPYVPLPNLLLLPIPAPMINHLVLSLSPLSQQLHILLHHDPHYLPLTYDGSAKDIPIH